MSTEKPDNTKQSPTAQVSPDKLGLGRTSGQRGAEIFAGVRAEFLPSPVNVALSRWSGRLTARMMKTMGLMFGKTINGYVNFMIARTDGITRLVQEAIPEDAKDILLVDIAAGFSPRGIQLAQAIPSARVIEIDLPDVILEKKRRLKRVRDFEIPLNLDWITADLGVQSLSDVLANQRVDAISAEGLTPYFAPADLILIASSIKDNLKSGGVFVTDMAWSKGVKEGGRASHFLSQQAGTFLGAMKNKEEAEQIFRDAGYDTVTVYIPTEISQRFGFPQPANDLQFLVVAKKAEIATTTDESKLIDSPDTIS